MTVIVTAGVWARCDACSKVNLKNGFLQFINNRYYENMHNEQVI